MINLLHWRDPIKTGLVFGISTTLYILLGLMDFTVVSLVSYFDLTLLAVCIVYVVFIELKATWLQGKAAENPLVEHFKGVDFHVSKETAARHLDTVLDLYNLAVDQFLDIFFVTNVLRSFKYLALFYVIGAYIGTWLSGLTLAFLVLLGAFTWPRVYEEKRDQIDQVFHLVQSDTQKYLGLVASKLPPPLRDLLVRPARDAAKKRD